MTCPFCQITHKAVVPTIHNNGTAAETLRDQYQAAVDGARILNRALNEAFPNARDYYLIPGQIAAAKYQANSMNEETAKILRTLIDIRDHIQAVINFKEQAKGGRPC